jgi:uncharacterized protein (DUF885 family)
MSAQATETDRLNKWFEARYEEELLFSPIGLTIQGRKDKYDEIDTFNTPPQTPTDQQLAWKRQSVQTMKSEFNYDALTDDAKLSWDLWEYQYEEMKADVEMRRQHYIFYQLGGIHTFLPMFLIRFHTVESVDDMNAYISRIRAVGRAINQGVDLAKSGAEIGVRPPRFAYEMVSEQAQRVITGIPFAEVEEESALWRDVKAKVDFLLEKGKIDQAEVEQLRVQARAAMNESLKPAYQHLIDFMASDIANTDVEATGVGTLPNGEAYYNYRLAKMTTTDMTANEIHQLGLEEVARLRGEMETLKEASGFEGSLQDFFTFIRASQDDERFYYPNDDAGRQAYIDDATAAIENIKAQLPSYFGMLPKADLEVRRVEPFREQDGAPQHYFRGTPDGTRPGIYYAHLSDMKAMPKNQLEVISYHEGLPGHHMQVSIAQESEGVPTFRTQARFTAYSEGWALYSELLAKEMPNTYTDVYSDFGRLTTEIWRAIRLVVDTGLHAKGWSQQQAVDYFASNSPAPQEAIEAEVRRYLIWPGQATAYKIGMLDILRLRKMSEEALKDNFNIRAFHDVVLGAGALPLKLLDRRVKQWIARQSTTPANLR